MSLNLKINKENEIYSGKIFVLKRFEINDNKGNEFSRDVILHPGAVALIPILENNNLMLIKQRRFAVNDYIYEIPAGTLELNESPEECAFRELIEEVGYRSDKITFIRSFFSCPGFCTEKIHLFKAEKLSPDASFTKDEDEDITMQIFNKEEIINMYNNGIFQDAKTIIGINEYLKNQ